MGQILAIVSSKGGVGKTTTAVNMAAAFASLDFPTLLVEADPQCGLVANFGYDRFDIPKGLADVARGDCPIGETTFETPVDGLHLVSSNVWSQEEEALYVAALERDPLALRRALAPLKDAYDYVMIDAPPMLGPVTVAILAAADRYLVPVQTEPQSVRALGRLIETAGKIRDAMNPGLIFDGIALTMVDSRTRMSQELADELRAAYPDHVFTATIPRSVRLAQVPGSGRPLVVAAPATRGARAYSSLAEEVLLQHARERAMARPLPASGGAPRAAATDPARAGLQALAARMAEFADPPAEKAPANGDLPDLAALGLPAEDEWDERFVDLETYLEMESGGGAKTAVADNEWDEDESWSNWDRDEE